MSNPKYTDPANRIGSASLPAVPPFSMKNVTCRAFPLKANIATLNSFCDQYLNMDIPPEIVRFRPGLPYVYLLLLDYGSMSPVAIEVQNLGWVAQDEMLFMVPLQRWREEAGRMVFKDWACVSPFIFVTDAMSQRTGREVYGWPKVLGEIEAQVPRWTDDPRLPMSLFKMKVDVFPKSYAGEQQEPRTLVEIRQEPRLAFTTIPPDANNPWGMFSMLSNAVSASVGLTIDALDMLAGMRFRGYRTNRTGSDLVRMADAMGSYLSLLWPDLPWIPRGTNSESTSQGRVRELSIEQVTLKQFQDAANPIAACYQALVASYMGIDRLNAAGLLGDASLLRCDPAGGFSVHIHRYDSQPIIESLGLEVQSQTEAADGSQVAVLKPTLPFWTDVDLNYGAGKVLCSRIPPVKSEPVKPDAREKINWRDEKLVVRENRNAKPLPHIPFNTALGAATQAISGPFHFPDTTIQVYPLLADKDKLQSCIDRYVNAAVETKDPPDFRFDVLGSYAYLIFSVYGDEQGTMWSESNNVGWWADREVSFCIPVKWYEKGQLKSLAMVAPFVFASNGRAALTDREVNGRPTINATIESPQDPWFYKPGGPNKARRLLNLTTEIFPALNLGQPSEQLTLLEIDQTQPLNYYDDVGWRLVSEGWGQEVVNDLKRLSVLRDRCQDELIQAKALALEILASEQPINWINIKQYRATEDAREACYQALIHTTRRIDEVYGITEIETPINIDLHRYPGQPIAETLGLKIKCIDSSKGCVVQHLQPIRPFWMRVSVCDDLGRVLYWRSGNEVGTAPSEDGNTYFGRKGYTRAVKSLGEGGLGGKMQRLKQAAGDELRKTLIQELKENWEDIKKSNTEQKKPPATHAIAEPAQQEQSLAKAYGDANLDELQVPVDAESVEAFAGSRTTEALYQSTEAIIAAMPEFKSTRARVSRSEAESAITSLDEVQIVIESILSDEWGNWGNPRWYQSLPPLPELCIRADTINTKGGFSWPPSYDGLESKEGWIYFDPEPAKSSSPQRARNVRAGSPTPGPGDSRRRAPTRRRG